jgi:hypothetical protein
LIAGRYLPDDENDIMGQLNAAMNAVKEMLAGLHVTTR